MSNHTLSRFGLVSVAGDLLNARHKAPELYNEVKRAEKAYAEHLAFIEATKSRLGLHLESVQGGAEIIMVEYGVKVYAAHARLVETKPGVWETKVDFFTPQKI